MHLHGLPISVKDYNNSSGVGTIYGSQSIYHVPYQLDERITILEQNVVIPSLLKQATKLNFDGACCSQLSKALTLFRLSFASPKSIQVFSLK